MDALKKEQLAELSSRIAARKAVLVEEIRRGLARAGMERYADLVGQSSDSADASVATLLRDITQAEVRRDVLEVRDILAAEARMAAGREERPLRPAAESLTGKPASCELALSFP